MISEAHFVLGCDAFAAAWAAGSGRADRWRWHEPPSALHRPGQGPRFIALSDVPIALAALPPLPPAAYEAPLGGDADRHQLGEDVDAPEEGDAAEDSDAALLPPAVRALCGQAWPAAAEAAAGGSIALCDYHVVYHPSYRVPVLCLLPRHADGRRLTWSEVISCLAFVVSDDVHGEDRWDVVTEQDHPVLNRPCYVLHPCQTAKLLQLLLPSLHSGALYNETARGAATLERQPDATTQAAEITTPSACGEVEDRRQGSVAQPPAAASAKASPWQLHYMLAWWSLVGPLVKLALPVSTCM